MSADIEEEAEKISKSSYPHTYPVSMTHTEFPSSVQLFEQAGLPFGAIITPFITRDDIPLSHSVKQAESAGDVGRCRNCGAYMNPFVNNSNPSRWQCSLCHERNDADTGNHARSRHQINKDGDITTPEEQHNLLCDFPQHFRAIDGQIPKCFEGKSAVPASLRPLVHVFVIQESMPPDGLQAVLDSLHSVVTESMHPDVQIVLMSFSNRVSIYHLRATATNGAGASSASGENPFHTPMKSQSRAVFGPPSRINLSQNRGRCRVPLYGNNASALALELQRQESVGDVLPNLGTYSKTEVGCMQSFESVGEFLSVAAPVEEARAHIEAALESIFDSWQIDAQRASATTAFTLEHDGNSYADGTSGVNRPADYGFHSEFNDTTLPGSADSSMPEMALGPVLEELMRWICEKPTGQKVHTDGTYLSPLASPMATTSSVFGISGDDMRAEIAKEEAEAEQIAGGHNTGLFASLEGDSSDEEVESGGVMSLLSDIGVGLISQTPLNSTEDLTRLDLEVNVPTARGISSENEVDDSELSEERLTTAPVDFCSGVILHIFVGKEQDLPPGWHVSVNFDDSNDHVSKRVAPDCGISLSWCNDMAARFAQKQVAVNLWGVSSFECTESCLHSLSPLAQQTGGTIRRVVLGALPRDEYARLREMLQRSCSTDTLATRGVLKLRTSQNVKVLENSITGHASEDEDFPGVYRLAQCTPASSFGLQLDFSDNHNNNNSRAQRVVIQMAFAYDTLIEGCEDIPDEVIEKNCDHENSDDVSLFLSRAGAIWGFNSSDEDIAEAMKSMRAESNSVVWKSKNAQFRFNRRFLYLHDRKNVYDTSPKMSPDSKSPKGRNKFKLKENKHFNARDVNPQMCTYDRTKRLLAVRRLRVFTCSIQCTQFPERLMRYLDPASLSLLIVRQALKDELSFRHQVTVSPHLRPQAHANFRKSHGKDQFAFVKSPGVECIDGWAASLIASLASVHLQQHGMSGRTVEDVVESSKNFPVVVRALQLLYGARVIILNERIQASNIAANRGLLRSNVADSSSNVWAHMVSDEFVELASLLLTCDVGTAGKVLFPQIWPVHPSMLCRPGNLNPTDSKISAEIGKDQIEWFVKMQGLQLRREALILDGAPAFLLDAGTHMILYHNMLSSSSVACRGAVFKGDPEALLKEARAKAAEDGTANTTSEPQNDAPGSNVENAMGSPASVASSRSWNILGRLDRLAGRLAGEGNVDTPQASPQRTDVTPTKQRNHPSTGNLSSDAATFSIGSPPESPSVRFNIDNFARGLYRLSSWLPSHTQRCLDSRSLVPRIISAEQGTSSASVLTRFLLMDIPDSAQAAAVKAIEDVCLLSYDTFVQRACVGACEELPELLSLR